MKYLTTGPVQSKKAYILAHGAGAPMDHEWMKTVSEKLAEKGIKVVRFEFPYMVERRETGKKRPPNTKKILLQTWKNVIDDLKQSHDEIYIGGKSMGGRMATLIEHDSSVKGIICLGFPFHALGKEPGERILHLETSTIPTLIIQGERDSMGKREEIKTYRLSDSIKIEFMPDGDHSLKPRVKSGFKLEDNINLACNKIEKFMNGETGF